jgi:hypothetical protein
MVAGILVSPPEHPDILRKTILTERISASRHIPFRDGFIVDLELAR